MARLVNCKKLKKELPGLDSAPYPGPKGEEIFMNVSKEAWDQWVEHQKMLINEGQLNLMDRDARKWLSKQMELFLSGEDYAKPKGYKPEK